MAPGNLPASVLMICFVEDPFDPPGHERFGGGHLFLFDLGRHFVRSGLHVTYVTRLNTPTKALRQKVGSRCDILRLDVGPPSELAMAEVAALRDDLVTKLAMTVPLLAPVPRIVHSHYWIAGLVTRELFHRGVFRDQRHLHSILSFGRLKRELGETPTEADDLRDAAELRIFTEADDLIAVCPNEASDLRRLYPEISREARVIPYGVDIAIFGPRPETPDSAVCRAYRRFKEGCEHTP